MSIDSRRDPREKTVRLLNDGLTPNPARRLGAQRAALRECVRKPVHGFHPIDEACPYCEPEEWVTLSSGWKFVAQQKSLGQRYCEWYNVDWAASSQQNREHWEDMATKQMKIMHPQVPSWARD